MLIYQSVRDDGERIKIVVKNVDGSGSITTGKGVAHATGASLDGVSVVPATAALQAGFCGIAAEDIPINGFGLAVAWGVADSVELSNVGSSITVTRGDILKPGAVAGTYFSSITAQAMSTLLYRYVRASTTNTISALSYVQGIVRAL